MSNFIDKLGFSVKKNAPTILTVTGLALMVTSTILACKAVPKAQKVLAQAELNYAAIKKASERAAEDEEIAKQYTEEDIKNDRKITSMQTTKGLVFAFGPAVLVGITGIACILSGHGIIKSRYTAVSSAYSALNLAFKNYRKRVIDKLGAEEEYKILNDIHTETIDEEFTVEETGETKVQQREVEVAGDGDPYTFIFDEFNPNWDKEMYTNIRFLEGQLNYFNNKLMRKGYVFLSDVLIALGFEPTRESFEIGWVYDLDDPDVDNFVDFGCQDIFEAPTIDTLHMGRDGIRLHFNPDGCITYLFPTKIRSKV